MSSPISTTSGASSPVINTGSIHINVPPSSMKRERNSGESARVANIEQRKTRIEFIRFEAIQVKQNDNEYGEVWLSRSPEESGSFAVIYLRNSVGGIYAKHVKAQIIFYNAAGREITSRLGCCWLDNKTDFIDFPVGETLGLIVAVASEGGTGLPWYRKVPFGNGYAGHAHEFEGEIAKGQVSKIEVILIGESDELLLRLHFGYSTVNGKPELIRQP